LPCIRAGARTLVDAALGHEQHMLKGHESHLQALASLAFGFVVALRDLCFSAAQARAISPR
jgi:hypothetical protein